MKLRELNQSDIEKDIYFMEVFSDNIVINDDYEGITVLDAHLNVIKEIGLEDIVIDASFKNTLTEELALFFHDEQRLFYFNLKNMNHQACDVKAELPVLSKYYVWGSDEIVFVTYDEDFYRYSMTENAFMKIDSAYVKAKYERFYSFWSETKDLPVISYDMDRLEIIANTRNNRYTVYPSNGDSIFLRSNYKPHDVHYSGETAMFVQEDIIELSCQGEQITLEPGERMKFLRGRFLAHDKIAVLSSHNSDLLNQIRIYQITD
ncbi:hypothetical protein [Bacillus swezeyi]|uniref:hypothetical protein n=1 Tax=Bacillus swezeyi TaxID=1925020 RepID=UPI00123C6BCA|nr:hypothetical protein [Bacillus swezeyi]KAA6473044.1 hypothetical protein DX928_22045 [Bacillus swezeyi]